MEQQGFLSKVPAKRITGRSQPGVSGAYGGINPDGMYSTLSETAPVKQGKTPDHGGNGGINPNGMYSTQSAATRPSGSQIPGQSEPGQSGKYGGINPGGDMSATGSGNPAASMPATAQTQPKTAKDYLDPETDTVEGRLTNMLGQNSDYMKRAETRGLQVANSRGLVNSSMAAGASQAAAIDAALPAAQQDAGVYAGFAERNQQLEHQRGLDADRYAQERATKQWEQENLAYSQLLKGVSDINMQDMSPEAKRLAVQNLWDMYMKGRPISSSLLDVQIIDGKIVRPTAAGGGAGESAAPGGAGKGESGGTGSAGGGNEKPGAMSDYWDYKSVSQMPTWMRQQYTSRYGNVDPQKAQAILSTAKYVNNKFKDYIVKDGKGGIVSPVTGVRLSSASAQREYDEFMVKQLNDAGLRKYMESIREKTWNGNAYPQVFRVVSGQAWKAPESPYALDNDDNS